MIRVENSQERTADKWTGYSIPETNPLIKGPENATENRNQRILEEMRHFSLYFEYMVIL